MISIDLTSASEPIVCRTCGTQMGAQALVCPACATLVHGETLRQIADRAEAATATSDPLKARVEWTAALALLPPESQQYAAINARITALTRLIDGAKTAPTRAPAPGTTWWQRGLGLAATLGLLLIGKLKFLVLGLTKASTFVSMFGFFGVYWSIYGWPLAAGLVVGIYIHEMGHVAMLRRLGIQSGAPLFVPGIGALVMLKQHVSDPSVDARIGLAGPRWGLAAAAAALVVYYVTGAEIWFAIAQLTAWVNLFNLTPIWQLDGSRGFHALNRQERWLIVAVILIMLMITSQSLLLIVGAVALYRALTGAAGPGDRRALATFAALVLCLSWLARGVR